MIGILGPCYSIHFLKINLYVWYRASSKVVFCFALLCLVGKEEVLKIRGKTENDVMIGKTVDIRCQLSETWVWKQRIRGCEGWNYYRFCNKFHYVFYFLHVIYCHPSYGFVNYSWQWRINSINLRFFLTMCSLSTLFSVLYNFRQYRGTNFRQLLSMIAYI